MIYLILKDHVTDKEIGRCEKYDLERYVYQEGIIEDSFYTVEEHACRGCQSCKPTVEERHDYYGITTGHWCDDCYENNYPYKKERYATVEYDGYGERLRFDY